MTGMYNAGRHDAGRHDASPYDAGRHDAGRHDASPYDASPYDAGRYDAGRYDAGPYDAGPDAAGPDDAGPDDAGPYDAGPDAARPYDAGPYDMAGPDALRQLVREVLRDVLPALANGAAPASAQDASGPARPGHEGLRDPDYPGHEGLRDPDYPGHDGLQNSAYPGHEGRRAAAGPPSRPPTSVPRSDPAEAASDGAAWAGAGRAGAGASRGGTTLPGADSDRGLQEVRLSTDEELRAFVLRVLRLADNPQRRRDILAGRLRFTLASAGGRQVPAVTHRVDKGAVTERAVIAAAKAGAGLVLGPRAVLTPLARDKARALGVPVEKER